MRFLTRSFSWLRMVTELMDSVSKFARISTQTLHRSGVCSFSRTAALPHCALAPRPVTPMTKCQLPPPNYPPLCQLPFMPSLTSSPVVAPPCPRNHCSLHIGWLTAPPKQFTPRRCCPRWLRISVSQCASCCLLPRRFACQWVTQHTPTPSLHVLL